MVKPWGCPASASSFLALSGLYSGSSICQPLFIYLTYGNHGEYACFVMLDKALTLSGPLTSTSRAFSMTCMSALLLYLSSGFGRLCEHAFAELASCPAPTYWTFHWS